MFPNILLVLSRILSAHQVLPRLNLVSTFVSSFSHFLSLLFAFHCLICMHTLDTIPDVQNPKVLHLLIFSWHHYWERF